MLASVKPIGIWLTTAVVVGLGFLVISQIRTPVATPARSVVQGKNVKRKNFCRQVPLQLKPARSMANVVDEKSAVLALCAALPWWNPPSVPSAFHELKLWGRHAMFTNKMLATERSGEWLVETMLDDAACQRNLSGEKGEYLLDSPYGIRIVMMGTEDSTRFRAQAHYGQLLKVLGEVGVSANETVTTTTGRKGTVEDIFQDELMRYAITDELEFMAIALAYWLPPHNTWRNQFDEEFSVDSLVQSLIDAPLGRGSCGGCHVPYAVVALLRADEIHPILKASTRTNARVWIKHLLMHLTAVWSERGKWDHTWSVRSESHYLWGDDLLDRITVTGHHLEWIAMLPADISPDETVVRRAMNALCADIELLPPLPHRSFKTMLPVSHAARALTLFRGDDPFTLWKKYFDEGYLTRDANKGYTIRIGAK